MEQKKVQHITAACKYNISLPQANSRISCTKALSPSLVQSDQDDEFGFASGVDYGEEVVGSNEQLRAAGDSDDAQETSSGAVQVGTRNPHENSITRHKLFLRRYSTILCLRRHTAI